MKLYLAGTVGLASREEAYVSLFQHRLLSFYEIYEPAVRNHAARSSFKVILSQNLISREGLRRPAYYRGYRSIGLKRSSDSHQREE